ncbi:VWA domain-containing protein [Thermus sp. PS18]|uniref:vWA domain-containing protein n=1 Tax=Thermus sp. PS18 TaxID=2849039 RepID=UPI002265158D|nr:VWA domain-containing protein [Thermus sp. PS18]UZX14696.1 VWA domain-containing protein [Thermus sp. PS18]
MKNKKKAVSQANPRPELELLPLKSGVRATGPTRMPVLLRVKIPPVQAEVERPPLNLAFVLDRSGSMAGDKLRFAKKAVAYAVENLRPHDRVAVVIYDHQVEVVVPSTLAGNKEEILRRLRPVRPRGSTNLHAGWLEGSTQVAAHLDAKRLNRVIVLSDGLANTGETNPNVIAEQVRGLSQRGVSTSTLGVGLGYNEDLMMAMAEAGQGNYYFIESPDDLPGIFAQELSGLATTLGTGVRLWLTPPHGGEIRLLHDLAREDGGVYRLPPLVGGRTLEYLLEVEAPGGEAWVGVRLTWESPGGGVQQEEASLHLPALEEEVYQGLDSLPEVEAAMAKLKATWARQQAMEALYRGDFHTARSSLSATLPLLAPYQQLLETEGEELEALLEELDRSPARARKLLSSQVYRNRQGRKDS